MDYSKADESHQLSSVQFSSVTQSCPTLCDPMIHSTPGLPIHHQLLEFTQTHFHRVRSEEHTSELQSLSCIQLFAIPWTAARQASLSITTSQSLLKLMSIESVMSSNRLILCHPLLPPSIFPSIRVFFSESALSIRWPKYWSFSISPFNEYSGLIFFRIDWFDLFEVQGKKRGDGCIL